MQSSKNKYILTKGNKNEIAKIWGTQIPADHLCSSNATCCTGIGLHLIVLLSKGMQCELPKTHIVAKMVGCYPKTQTAKPYFRRCNPWTLDMLRWCLYLYMLVYLVH